jgi:hypothetical protein
MTFGLNERPLNPKRSSNNLAKLITQLFAPLDLLALAFRKRRSSDL